MVGEHQPWEDPGSLCFLELLPERTLQCSYSNQERKNPGVGKPRNPHPPPKYPETIRNKFVMTLCYHHSWFGSPNTFYLDAGKKRAKEDFNTKLYADILQRIGAAKGALALQQMRIISSLEAGLRRRLR
eukprot:720485-Amphidinium_carterae.1